MEMQKAAPSIIVTGIRFGLLVAVVGILLDFIVRIAGTSILVYGIIAGTLGLIVAVVGIVLAHRAYRQANNNLLTISQGVGIAVIMLVISSLLSALFNYVYVNYIDPEFVGRMKEQMTDFMERNNLPDSQIQASIAKLEDLRPSLAQALPKALLTGALGGGIFGLIISLFTKRKPADFE